MNLLIFAASGALWAISCYASLCFLPVADHATGISLAFLPAGVRLLALLAGRGWAAAGTAFGSLLWLPSAFADTGVWQIVMIAIVTGLAPYVSLAAVCAWLRIGPDLNKLRASHLPIISLGVAMGSSIFHNTLFCVFSYQPWADWPEHLLAFASGDFVGSLLVMLIVLGGVRLWRLRPA